MKLKKNLKLIQVSIVINGCKMQEKVFKFFQKYLEL